MSTNIINYVYLSTGSNAMNFLETELSSIKNNANTLYNSIAIIHNNHGAFQSSLNYSKHVLNKINHFYSKTMELRLLCDGIKSAFRQAENGEYVLDSKLLEEFNNSGVGRELYALMNNGEEGVLQLELDENGKPTYNKTAAESGAFSTQGVTWKNSMLAKFEQEDGWDWSMLDTNTIKNKLSVLTGATISVTDPNPNPVSGEGNGSGGGDGSRGTNPRYGTVVSTIGMGTRLAGLANDITETGDIDNKTETNNTENITPTEGTTPTEENPVTEDNANANQEQNENKSAVDAITEKLGDARERAKQTIEEQKNKAIEEFKNKKQETATNINDTIEKGKEEIKEAVETGKEEIKEAAANVETKVADKMEETRQTVVEKSRPQTATPAPSTPVEDVKETPKVEEPTADLPPEEDITPSVDTELDDIPEPVHTSEPDDGATLIPKSEGDDSPSPTTPSSSGGNRVVPVVAGVAAAGAAGVGTKVYLDRKSAPSTNVMNEEYVYDDSDYSASNYETADTGTSEPNLLKEESSYTTRANSETTDPQDESYDDEIKDDLSYDDNLRDDDLSFDDTTPYEAIDNYEMGETH